MYFIRSALSLFVLLFSALPVLAQGGGPVVTMYLVTTDVTGRSCDNFQTQYRNPVTNTIWACVGDPQSGKAGTLQVTTGGSGGTIPNTPNLLIGGAGNAAGDSGLSPSGIPSTGTSTAIQKGNGGGGLTPAASGDFVASAFGRTGPVTATNGDYTAAQVTNAASTASANQFGTTSALFNQTFYGDFLMNSGTTAAEQYHLEGRVGVGIPVPNLTATAANTAIAFDIFPHGAAGDFNTIGNAWEDICNTDINTSGANYSCLRMGIHAAASSNVFIRSNGAGTGLTGNLDLQELGGMVGINLGANVQPTSELQVAFPKTTALGSGANWNTAQLSLYDSTNMAAGVGGAIGFVGNFVTSTTSFRYLAGIGASKTNGTSADQSGDLVGYSAVSATGYPTEGFRLSNSLGTFKLASVVTKLQFGGTTSSFPAFSRSGTTVSITGADGTATVGILNSPAVYSGVSGTQAGCMAMYATDTNTTLMYETVTTAGTVTWTSTKPANCN